jgi:cysteine-rich repeat protein
MARNPARALLAVTAALGVVACGGETNNNNNNNSNNNTAGGLKIDSFTASAASVASGGSVSLAWKVSGADSVSVTITRTPGSPVIEGSTNLQGSVESGPITADTTFKLSVTGGGKTVESGPVTVTVDAGAVSITAFDATPNPAAPGATVTLSWSTAGATKVTVLEGTTELFTSTTDVATGTFSVTLTEAAHTYTLRAENAVATTTDTVTVTTETPASITVFTVAPNTFSGASADVTITFAAQGERFTLTGNGQTVTGFTGQGAGNLTVTVTETTVFVFTAEGAGRTESAQAAVAQAVMEVEPNDDKASATPITTGAIGTLSTVDDVDFYSFTVPEGGNVFADVTDGMGGCNFVSVINLYDSVDEDPIASAVGGGVGDCAQLDPREDSSAANLPAGTYFISIETFEDFGDYSLVVLVGSPACGNRILEGTEQCDDGNTASGDSCNATCQIESLGSVSGIDQRQTFSGAIVPAHRVDYYQVTLPQAAYIVATTGVPTVGQCVGDADTVVRLWDDTLQLLATADDTGASACGELSPLFYGQDTLPAGSYWVSVESYRAEGSIAAYQVAISTFLPGCGNGVIEDTEQCDDGNTAADDGCSAQCTLETSGAISGAGGSATVTLGPPDSPAVFVEVTVLAGQSITATTSDGMGGCPTPNTMFLVDQAFTTSYGFAPGNGGCANIDPSVDTWAANLPAGTYLLGLFTDVGGTGGQVVVDVIISNAVCGNGILEDLAGEQCDDGGTAPGDGCDASCDFEGNISVESEPNNTSGQANPLNLTRGGPVVTVTGSINPLGDQDYYAFTVPTGQTASLVARTYPVLGDPTSCSFSQDTLLELFDGTGTSIAMNDDDENRNGFCSLLNAASDAGSANLPAGTYHLVVRHFDGSETFSGYFMDVQLVP